MQNTTFNLHGIRFYAYLILIFYASEMRGFSAVEFPSLRLTMQPLGVVFSSLRLTPEFLGIVCNINNYSGKKNWHQLDLIVFGSPFLKPVTLTH
jgi:hypothetical protein